MKEKVLTTIIIKNNEENIEVKNNYNEVEVLYSTFDKLKETVNSSQGEYISFIDDLDEIDNNYFELILKKIETTEFDTCYISNTINYPYGEKVKLTNSYDVKKAYTPEIGDFIWSFVYKKDIISKFLEQDEKIFNETLETIKNKEAIIERIYHHKKEGPKYKGLLRNRKPIIYLDNVIYIEDKCAGLFNGYVTWIIQLGKAIFNVLDKNINVTIIYDKISPEVLQKFEKYFVCRKRDNNFEYVTNVLLCTYSTYYYARNVNYIQDSCLFIHGNMSDYEHAAKFPEDCYTKYIAVSKVSAEKAVGYFNTDKIDYIYNPYYHERNKVKPHLRLISAQRWSDEKRMDRIIKAAKMLDELGIPYTWNVFTDKNEGTNQGGLIFRHRVMNIIDYLSDADYFVLFSNSEALPYCVTEALVSNLKVLGTPLEALEELGVKDDETGFIFPFEVFEDGHEKELKEILIKAYINKNRKINYVYKPERYIKYNDVFYKSKE